MNGMNPPHIQDEITVTQENDSNHDVVNDDNKNVVVLIEDDNDDDSYDDNRSNLIPRSYADVLPNNIQQRQTKKSLFGRTTTTTTPKRSRSTHHSGSISLCSADNDDDDDVSLSSQQSVSQLSVKSEIIGTAHTPVLFTMDQNITFLDDEIHNLQTSIQAKQEQVLCFALRAIDDKHNNNNNNHDIKNLDASYASSDASLSDMESYVSLPPLSSPLDVATDNHGHQVDGSNPVNTTPFSLENSSSTTTNKRLLERDSVSWKQQDHEGHDDGTEQLWNTERLLSSVDSKGTRPSSSSLSSIGQSTRSLSQSSRMVATDKLLRAESMKDIIDSIATIVTTASNLTDDDGEMDNPVVISGGGGDDDGSREVNLVSPHNDTPSVQSCSSNGLETLAREIRILQEDVKAMETQLEARLKEKQGLLGEQQKAIEKNASLDTPAAPEACPNKDAAAGVLEDTLYDSSSVMSSSDDPKQKNQRDKEESDFPQKSHRDYGNAGFCGCVMQLFCCLQ